MVTFKDFISEISVPQGTTGKRTTWNPPLVTFRNAAGKKMKAPPGKSASSGGGGSGNGGNGGE